MKQSMAELRRVARDLPGIFVRAYALTRENWKQFRVAPLKLSRRANAAARA